MIKGSSSSRDFQYSSLLLAISLPLVDVSMASLGRLFADGVRAGR